MDVQEILRIAAARRHGTTGTGRVIREHARLTLREVADAIGIDQPMLSRWETGKRRPCGPAAMRWLELLEQLDDLAKAV